MGKPETQSASLVTFLAVVGSCLLVGVPFFELIDRYAVNVPFWDQWDAYRPIFEERSWWAVFSQQHGPPRLGLGLVVSKLVAELTAWNIRVESYAVGSLIAAAMGIALFLKVRLFGGLTVTDALIPALFLTTMQYESLVIVPLPAHGAMPLVLVLLMAVAWTLTSPAARYIAVAVLNFLLVFTGFGLFMGLVTPVVLAFDLTTRARRQIGGWMWPAGALLASLASLYAFTIGYAVDPATGGVNVAAARPWDVVWFVGLMLSRYLGIPHGIAPTAATVVGLTMVSVMLAVAIHHAVQVLRAGVAPGSVSLTVLMMVGFTLLFACATALGRMASGVTVASQSSRYVTLIIPSFLALYFHVLTLRSSVLRAVPIAVLAVLMLPWPLTDPDMKTVQGFSDAKHAWKDCYLEIENAPECDRRVGFFIYPASSQLTERLAYLKSHRLSLFADVEQ